MARRSSDSEARRDEGGSRPGCIKRQVPPVPSVRPLTRGGLMHNVLIMTAGGHRGRSTGFTLIELLAVIAIILVLASLLITGYGPALEKGRSVICRSNMRQLQVGLGRLAIESDGRLPSGSTTYNGPNAALPWAESNDFASVRSALWPYVREERIYACPSYPLQMRESLKRHYSVSGFLNAEGPCWGSIYAATTLSEVKSHSRTMCLIEEYDHRSKTTGERPGPLGAYVVWYTTQPSPCGWNAGQNKFWVWTDTPPFWHDWGAFFTFLDGHVEYKKWEGPKMRTVDVERWPHDSLSWKATDADIRDYLYMTAGVTNGLVREQ
jgi:prepilin-type N-terminal cleavage/methylation domain-containing protein